jgi:hypothetical protein
MANIGIIMTRGTFVMQERICLESAVRRRT